MTRDPAASNVIRAAAARDGFVSRAAMRAYVESRLSRLEFTRACNEGIAMYKRAHGKLPPPPGGVEEDPC